MRFLTRDWFEGKWKDQYAHVNFEVYLRHLEEIGAELPPGARTFAAVSMGMRLVGAQIVATTLDEEAETFTLVLRVHGRDADYFLELEYLGVDADTLELEDFPMAEACLTEEFHRGTDDMLEHRILLSPQGEAVIRFKDIRFHSKQAADTPDTPDDEATDE
jgi:hypothetical protein